MEGLTQIEKVRAQNILRNNERIAAAGLDPASIARTCPALIRSLPSSRRQRVPASLPPSSIQLRVRGARPQYCDRINNEDDAGSSESYTPSTATMSDAGDDTAAGRP